MINLKARFIKVVKVTHPINWWNRYGILGKTFEVLAISKYDYAKIEYEEGFYGWLPLEVCEINPHLKKVGSVKYDNTYRE